MSTVWPTPYSSCQFPLVQCYSWPNCSTSSRLLPCLKPLQTSSVCEKSLLDSKQFLFGTKCITDFTVDPGPHFLVRPGPTFVNRNLVPDATEGFPSAVLRVLDCLPTSPTAPPGPPPSTTTASTAACTRCPASPATICHNAHAIIWLWQLQYKLNLVKGTGLVLPCLTDFFAGIFQIKTGSAPPDLVLAGPSLHPRLRACWGIPRSSAPATHLQSNGQGMLGAKGEPILLTIRSLN